jgi:hypothetical protein
MGHLQGRGERRHRMARSGKIIKQEIEKSIIARNQEVGACAT